MVNLKKYQMNGKPVADVELEDWFLEVTTNSQMIKDYITAIRANARQWSASTKTRSEVNHSTQKPHKQKGLGRARQGSLAAPQYKGGGRVFAPRPKFDQHVKINRKERRMAIRQLLAEKVRAGNFTLLADANELREPKTKTMAAFLDAVGFQGKRVLFLGEGSYEHAQIAGREEQLSAPTVQHEVFIKSIRNLPRVEFSLAKNISGYDILVAHEIVATEAALAEIKQWLG